MKKNISLIITIIGLLVIGGSVAFYAATRTERTVSIQGKPRIVEEKPVIPNTEKVYTADARMLEQSGVAVPLAPKTEEEKVIVPQAELTLKEAYAAAARAAQKWDDAALFVFVKALGTVTLDGKSSGWQVLFSSPDKRNMGYEIIISGGTIASEKEVASDAVGAAVPEQWKDLGEVIAELQTHPLYQNATVNGASFHLNPDNKKWYYGILTSKGASTIAVE